MFPKIVDSLALWLVLKRESIGNQPFQGTDSFFEATIFLYQEYVLEWSRVGKTKTMMSF